MRTCGRLYPSRHFLRYRCTTFHTERGFANAAFGLWPARMQVRQTPAYRRSGSSSVPHPRLQCVGVSGIGFG